MNTTSVFSLDWEGPVSPTFQGGHTPDSTYVGIPRIPTEWDPEVYAQAVQSAIDAPDFYIPPRTAIGRHKYIKQIPELRAYICVALFSDGVNPAEFIYAFPFGSPELTRVTSTGEVENITEFDTRIIQGAVRVEG